MVLLHETLLSVMMITRVSSEKLNSLYVRSGSSHLNGILSISVKKIILSTLKAQIEDTEIPQKLIRHVEVVLTFCKK
ncbi:unnamed protein product [Acanthoscelides obtectus]|uniref:Uncharacterized protein n=1 Tax=Acanthoscelides obtectus TaxID=200917 RepID=A0A9P0Q639_ACAOB|nr:unnamed protein product [Acanthoscelides obtectus]CAK1646900.1 hypothetical protein AOBTE_LOCUS14930 [Acanthoscelides obtectus]